jgi:hypothetical protein
MPDTERENQQRELERVRRSLGGDVLRFCWSHRNFHLTDLLAHIRSRGADGAPDSPSRILRDLRQRHLLDYAVTSRRASAYRVMWTALDDGRLF